MNLNEILNSATTILNQINPTLTLSIERFNLLLKLVNYDYFKLWCGLPEQWQPGSPITSRGWQVSESNTEALRPFLVSNQNLTIDSDGTLPYPTNLVHLSRIGYFNSITSKPRPVEILTHEEIDDRLGNPITAPEYEYPVMVYENTYMQFYPNDLLNVTMSYLRLPVTPVYALKQQNNIDVYDPDNSVQFEWHEQYHNDLVRMLVGYLAPSNKDYNLINFVETKKAQGV